jgi:hypothetical protein
MNRIGCDRVRDWIDGAARLTPAEAARAEEHLRGCSACAAVREDARFLGARLRDHVPRRCPDAVVQRIWEEIEAEAPVPWLRRAPGRLLRAALPAAAVALLLFALTGRAPTPAPDDLVAIAPPQSAPAEPCDLDIDEILRRLGLDRSQVPYDDQAICDAAEDALTALEVVGAAMDRTARVIGRETRERMAEPVRKGLERGVGSPTMDTSGSTQGG